MTLDFSSFSIKAILSGRNSRGKLGTGSAEEQCGAKRNICSAAQNGTRVPDLCRPDAEESRILPGRLPPDLMLPSGNLRAETYSEKSTGEDSELTEGEEFYSVWQNKSVKIKTGLNSKLKWGDIFRSINREGLYVILIFGKKSQNIEEHILIKDTKVGCGGCGGKTPQAEGCAGEPEDLACGMFTWAHCKVWFIPRYPQSEIN